MPHVRSFSRLLVALCLLLTGVCVMWHKGLTSPGTPAVDQHWDMHVVRWQKEEALFASLAVSAEAIMAREKCAKDAKITFVMPTFSSRPDIFSAIESIWRLHDCTWRLIVVYADVTQTNEATASVLQDRAPIQLSFLPPHYDTDPRISFLPFSVRISKNYGGSQRNAAYEFVTTEWIGFLDDDDTITPDYITHLIREVESYPEASAVLFRMYCGRKCRSRAIIPPPTLFELKMNFAGISFAGKTDVLKRHRFVDGPTEDFGVMHAINRCEKQWVLSGAITYRVKGIPIPSVDRIPTVLKYNNKIDECTDDLEFAQPLNLPMLGFRFPEIANPLFKSNIRGLIQSLESLRKLGCLGDDSYFDKLHIELHFGPYTSIQYEDKIFIQVHSDVPDTNKNIFNAKYLVKLKRADQVWVIWPSHFRFLSKYIGLKNVFLVSFSNFLDLNPKAAVIGADNENLRKYCVRHTLRRWGSGAGEGKIEQCIYVSAGCNVNAKKNIRCNPASKILMFGRIDGGGSDAGKRIEVCAWMKAKYHDGFDCYDTEVGPPPFSLLSTASIIVLDGQKKKSNSEIYNIEPLLLQGKVVISTRSLGNENFESTHKNTVIFVDSLGEVVTLVATLLSQSGQASELITRNRQVVRKMSRNSEGLCAALRTLRVTTLRQKTVQITTSKNSEALLWRWNNNNL